MNQQLALKSCFFKWVQYVVMRVNAGVFLLKDFCVGIFVCVHLMLFYIQILKNRNDSI